MATDDLEYGTAGARFVNARRARLNAAKSPLADDRKNRFEKHDERRRTALAASDTQAERIQRNEQQRQEWTHLSTTATTASGVKLDSETAKLKVASDADRLARRNALPVAIPSTSLIIAVVEKWQREQHQFFESIFNYNSLINFIVTQIAGGSFVLSVESIADAYTWLLANNFLETAANEYFDAELQATVRSRNGLPVAGKHAPEMYPKYVWPSEEAAVREAELAESLAEHQAGRKEAEGKSFLELQAEVRSQFKAPRPGGPNLDRSE